MSRTSSVIAMASTPSLNASVRSVSHRFSIRTGFDARRICPPDRVPRAVHAEPARAVPATRRAIGVNSHRSGRCSSSRRSSALAWALVFVRTAVLTIFFALFAALVLEPVVTLVQRTAQVGPRPDGHGRRARDRRVRAHRRRDPALAVRELGAQPRRRPAVDRPADPGLVDRFVVRQPQPGAGGGSEERQADRRGARQRRRRRDRRRRLGLQPDPRASSRRSSSRSS